MKLNKLFYLLPLIFSGLTSCNKQEDPVVPPSDPGEKTVHVESISFSQESIELEVGETYDLEVTVLPENATNKNYYYVFFEDIISIQGDTITALSKGTIALTVYSEDGDLDDFIEVIVREETELNFNFENDKKAIDVSSNIDAKNFIRNEFGKSSSPITNAAFTNLYLDYGGIRFGNQGGAGSMQLKSNRTITNIKMTVKTYWTVNQYYSGGDSNTQVDINGQKSNVLGHDENGAIETVVEFDFEEGIKDITIQNVYPTDQTQIDAKNVGRFILYSMTITYLD